MTAERICVDCGERPQHVRSYCRECKNARAAKWRRDNPLTPEQRIKMIARSYAKVYLKRGKITRQPCEVCGTRAEMHHDDYSRPVDVRWLCREHHLAWHAENDRPANPGGPDQRPWAEIARDIVAAAFDKHETESISA